MVVRVVLAVLFAVVVTSAAIVAEDVWVDDDACPGPGSGSASDPFCSIQLAYDASVDGDEIRVRPGTYRECVRANDPVTRKTVTFIADGFDPAIPNTANLTTIDGSGIPGCARDDVDPFTPTMPVVDLGGDGSSLSGFRIVGGGASGVRALGSVTITHNLIEGNDKYFVGGGGIFVLTNNCAYGETTTIVAKNVIRANHTWTGGGGICVRAGSLLGRPAPCPAPGNAVLSIVDNIVEANTADERSGGIEVVTNMPPGFSAEVVITRNAIAGNQTYYEYGDYDAWGGGIYVASLGAGEETIRLFDNTIEDNYARSSGGGLSASVGVNNREGAQAVRHWIVIEDNVIRRNTTGWGGGGMELFVGGEDLASPHLMSLLATNNLVEDNLVTGDISFAFARKGGGGVAASMYSERSSPEAYSLRVAGNIIRKNRSHRRGGGISAESMAVSTADRTGTVLPSAAWMEITGNLIVLNQTLNGYYTDARGGGAELDVISLNDDADSGIAFWLNTVADNVVENAAEGGGVHIDPGTRIPYPGFTAGRGHVELSSNIISGNQGFGIDVTPPIIAPAASDKVYNTYLTVDVSYSDVVNNAAGGYGSWLGELTGLFGNVSLAPSYVDAPAGDYHLSASSPLIDSGDPVVRPNTPDHDADGDARIFDGSGDGAAIVDMGYDEWVPQPIQVAIDIQPGDAANSINPRSRGVIPVAVLAGTDFDVSTVDLYSVRFGPERAPESHSAGGHFEDVNADGLIDLVLHFRTQSTGIACGDESAALDGRTLDGVLLHGVDAITTVGCSGGGRARAASEETAERRTGRPQAVSPRAD